MQIYVMKIKETDMKSRMNSGSIRQFETNT